MHSFALMLAACTLSIDVGWQPLENGELEYIIQIEPQMLETLKAGQDVVSDIPPYLKTIRSYRITIGNGPLPRRLGIVPRANAPTSLATADPSRLATTAGRPPANEGKTEERTLAAPPPGLPAEEPALPADPPSEPAAETVVEDMAIEPVPSFVESEPPVTADIPATETPTLDISPNEQTFSPPSEPLHLPTELTTPGERPATHTESALKAEIDQRKANAEAPHAEADSKGNSAASSGEMAGHDEKPPAVAVAKPWWPLTATLLGLFFSIGGNFYLGWSMWGLRAKYRTVLERFQTPVRSTADKAAAK